MVEVFPWQLRVARNARQHKKPRRTGVKILRILMMQLLSRVDNRILPHVPHKSTVTIEGYLVLIVIQSCVRYRTEVRAGRFSFRAILSHI